VQSVPAASSSAPPASASSASTSKPKPYEEPPIENGGTAPCYKYGKLYGEGAPTADEMLAVVRKFPADCGPKAWQLKALRACMDKVGDPYVVVMHGHMDGPKSNEPFACQIALVGAAWSGGRFVVVRHFYRDKATFFGYNQVYELRPGAAPELFVDGREKHSPLCQFSAPDAGQPAGWNDLPADLQDVFCH
jgi:hypothetical protein